MHEILLEAGTNEAEFLEFLLGNESYGINVAKIKQLVKYDPDLVTPLPDSDEALLGTIEHLGKQVPVIDLCICLKMQPNQSLSPKIVIITDFNQALMGFMVDGVNKIHRVSWDLLQPVSAAMEIYQPRLTGTVIIGETEMLILDFEHILDEYQGLTRDPQEHMQAIDHNLAQQQGRKLADVRVMVVEDSILFRQLLEQLLRKSGLSSTRVYDNGMEALMALKRAVRNRDENNDDRSCPELIITDIEMPQMDGLRFCKEVRSMLPDVPLIVLSSLITDQMRLKCESVGADASVSKKDLNGLYVAIRDLLKR